MGTSLTGKTTHYFVICVSRAMWLTRKMGVFFSGGDRPFVDARAQFHGMSLPDEIGFAPDSQNEYKCRPVIHMDAFRCCTHIIFAPVLLPLTTSSFHQMGEERQLSTSGQSESQGYHKGVGAQFWERGKREREREIWWRVLGVARPSCVTILLS